MQEQVRGIVSETFAQRMSRYHGWLKFSLFLLCGGGVVLAQFWPQETPDTVHLFADRLRDIIMEGRAEDLRALPCRPVNCVNERVVKQVIGGAGQEGFVRRFLKRPEISLRVYEPFSLEQLMDGDDYLLFFYDPHAMRFAARAYPSVQDQRALWRKSYIETRVSFRDGKWTLVGAPFLSRPATEIDLRRKP